MPWFSVCIAKTPISLSDALHRIMKSMSSRLISVSTHTRTHAHTHKHTYTHIHFRNCQPMWRTLCYIQAGESSIRRLTFSSHPSLHKTRRSFKPVMQISKISASLSKSKPLCNLKAQTLPCAPLKSKHARNLHIRAYNSEPLDIQTLPPFLSFYTGAYVSKTPTLIRINTVFPKCCKKKVRFPTLIKTVLLCVRGRIGMASGIRRRHVSVHHHPLMWWKIRLRLHRRNVLPVYGVARHSIFYT